MLHEELGVVVVTYSNPGVGNPPGQPTTTAPTAAQASQLNEIYCQVFFADSDTAATITHNWGLPNSYPTWGWPQVFYNKSLGGGSDLSFATNFTFGLTNTNSVTMTKIGLGTGQGGTYNVYLRRPHSLGS